MRLPELRTALLARSRHPAYWIGALAVFMAPLSAVLATPSSSSKVVLFGKGIALMAGWIPGLILCPLPWQWTGDDRPLAGWIRGLAQMAAFSLLMAALLMVPYHFLLRIPDPQKTSLPSYLLGLWVGLSFTVFLLEGTVGLVVARLEQLAQEARRAKTRAQEAQWMSHRGAFSPRLLFSNLDHLADLAPLNQRRTEQGLVDLAALYRQWLLEAEKPLVPLASERILCEQYLALEHPRWGQALKVRWHLDPDLEDSLVPSLLFLPLLESILGRGPEAGSLALDFRPLSLPRGLQLVLDVAGPCETPPEEILRTLRQRIRTVTGEGGEVALKAGEGGWSLTIHLPDPGVPR